MQALLGQFTHELVFTALITVVLSIAGALLMWPIRKAKEAWHENQDRLDKISAELAVQRTNCLSTLQSQGDKQIELLTKTVSTLEAIHLSQAEMSGYFKGSK